MSDEKIGTRYSPRTGRPKKLASGEMPSREEEESEVKKLLPPPEDEQRRQVAWKKFRDHQALMGIAQPTDPPKDWKYQD